MRVIGRFPPCPPSCRKATTSGIVVFSGGFLLALCSVLDLAAATLWTYPGATLIYDSGTGRDILEGALKRDDTSNDTLYFKFHVDPLSDSTTEEYVAAFELFEGDEGRIGIGNAPEAWAYSVFLRRGEYGEFGPGSTYLDLRSGSGQSGPDALPGIELPRKGVKRTIVFKVQFVARGEDLVTVWLHPDLSAGATEIHQPESLTTRFSANASFDEIRLCHGGGGGGWVFSDLAIATSFHDFVDPSSAMPRAIGSGAPFDAQPFSVRSWQREPNMPVGAIQALAQTADGYLWLASDDQVSRFDGVRFTSLDLQQGRIAGSVQVLFGDSHGALWIGTSNRGLVRYADGRFETFTRKDGLPGDEITTIAEDDKGKVWIGTRAGLAAWNRGKLQTPDELERLDGCAITALFRDHAGMLWIGAEREGVFRFHEGALSELPDSRTNSLLLSPQCLLRDREDRLWVGAGEDFVLCREGDGWYRYRIPRESGTPHLRVLALDTDGSVWAGSASDGLFQFSQGRLVSVNSAAGLHDGQTFSLLVDREGNLWVGGGSGLHLLRREPTVRLGQMQGLGHGPVAGVAEVAPGVIWAIQQGRGLFRWEGGSFRRLSASGLNPGDDTLGPLLVSRNGSCWIACNNGLLLVRDPQAVADESLLFELPHATITSLEEGHDGSIWAGTREGQVWQLHAGKWSRRLGLTPPVAITSLAAEPGGTVWAGTDGEGVHRIDGSGSRRFEHGALGDSVFALHQDTNGTLWVSTDHAGLVAIAGGRVSSFGPLEGLPGSRIRGILEDGGGRLWLMDESGLSCIAKPSIGSKAVQVLALFATGPARADNTALVQAGERIFPRGCRTRSGHLWFATPDGIVVVAPPDFAADRVRSRLILEEVLVDGVQAAEIGAITAGDAGLEESAFAMPRLRLGPGGHRLEVHFTMPHFSDPGQVRFRYRMEGLDPDWVDAGTARRALYSYLPPGEYRFTVAAAGPGGAVSQASVGLWVPRHLWQQWWAIGGATVALLAAIGGGARFVEKRRVLHRLRRLEQEHALERERSRIAQDLHDEMGAKLCRISFLSEHAHRLDPGSGEIKEQVASIAENSRELLHSLDEIVWVVNPHNDTLEHVASYIGQYVQNYLQGTGIECELDIAGGLPHKPVSSQTRHHLFLAVHEALTNVLKHSGASRVNVTVSYRASVLAIQVADNGRGFAAPERPFEAVAIEPSGDGLANMRRRMESIGGDCRVESAPGRGTSVRFSLNLERTHK